jgi:hypothetical protein
VRTVREGLLPTLWRGWRRLLATAAIHCPSCAIEAATQHTAVTRIIKGRRLFLASSEIFGKIRFEDTLHRVHGSAAGDGFDDGWELGQQPALPILYLDKRIKTPRQRHERSYSLAFHHQQR